MISKYLFLIIFKPSYDMSIQTDLISEIITKYKSYISKSNPLKSDFKIAITEQNINTINFIPDNQNKSIYLFTNFYEKKRVNYYVTYYYISLYQFNHLLLTIIEKLLSLNRGFILRCTGFLYLNKHILTTTYQNTSLPLTNTSFPKDKITINKSAIIKKIGAHFFAFQNPCADSRKKSSGYPIDKLIIFTDTLTSSYFVRMQNKNDFINIIIRHSNISKYSDASLENSESYAESMKTILSFISKVDVWNLRIGKKRIQQEGFLKYLKK